jgi:REP element-mobilizing transposase RayT
MPSTHLSLHYHIVFSTKNRIAHIGLAWRSRLHDYLGGCIRTCGGAPDKIGGTEDHVHLLMELRGTHRLSDVMRDIKSASSAWVHQEIQLKEFAWQDGYGAFSLSVGHRRRLVEYIEHQEQHHKARGFQEEYVALLKAHGVVYDERYLW